MHDTPAASAGCAALLEELPLFLGAQRDLFDTPRAFSTLVALSTLEHAGALRASALAQVVLLDPSTVTRQTTHLRAQGWVEAQPDPDDGRAQHLRLTDAGRAELGRLRSDLTQRLQHQLDGWSEEEMTTLAAALRRYADCSHRAVTGDRLAPRHDPTPSRGAR